MTPARLFVSVVAWRRRLLAALLACATLVAAGEVALPWLLAQAVDAALGETSAARLDRIGLAMLAVIGGLYVMHCLLLRVESRLLYEASFRLRQRLYRHTLEQPLAFFHRTKAGELVHRVVSDAAVFEDNAVNLFSDLPFELMTVVGVLTIMIMTDLRLAALIVGFLVVAATISAWLGRPLPTLRKSIQAAGARFSSRFQEAVSGIRTVKVFGAEPDELARLDASNREIASLEVRGGRRESLLVPVFDLMELLGVVLVVWYGAHLIIAKAITPGALVAFIAYMEILAGPVSRAGRSYRYLQQCRGVCQRLAEFLGDGQPESEREPRRPAGWPGRPWSVEFDDVSFTYPGALKPAIDRVSFRVAPGEIVAVVGRNGAGKSTLLDLLLRLQDPTGGVIRVGGRDVREWDRRSWRLQLGVMPQEVFLFHATVCENIAYGRPTASADEITACAQQARLSDLLARLPQGLQTVVGDRGNRLSGGERQRVALARTLLKDPNLFLLDEPTAHLDGHAAAVIGEALTELGRNRTTFVVAHRVETVMLAERVLFLDGGRIAGFARHPELMQSDPRYAELFATDQRGRWAARSSSTVAPVMPASS